MTQACFADALGMALAERACGPLFGLTGSGNIQLAAAFQAAGGRFVTVRRYGGRAQSYHADSVGQWVREFEVDLTCRFFK